MFFFNRRIPRYTFHYFDTLAFFKWHFPNRHLRKYGFGKNYLGKAIKKFSSGKYFFENTLH